MFMRPGSVLLCKLNSNICTDLSDTPCIQHIQYTDETCVNSTHWQSDNVMGIQGKVNSEYLHKLDSLHSGGFNGLFPRTKPIFKDGCAKDYQGEINSHYL